MPTSKVRTLTDRKASTPEAANSRLKALRQVFVFGINSDLVERNPARDVPYIRTGSQGFHTWTIEEVQQYEARHPVGTKARLALGLLLFTGQPPARKGRLAHLHPSKEPEPEAGHSFHSGPPRA
jgi:hypothetical protein